MGLSRRPCRMHNADEPDPKLHPPCKRWLNKPPLCYQNQGFLVEEDAQNWVRFDTYSDGDRLYAFGAFTVNGVTTFGFQVAVPGNSAPYLQLTRSGDTWTFGDDPDNTVTGSATGFAQTVTQTRNVADTDITTTGPVAGRWMALAQCFAGPPEDPPAPGTRFVRS